MSSAVLRLVVDHPVAFARLGHKSVLRWALDHLFEIRGLTRRVSVVSPKFWDAFHAEYADEFDEVLSSKGRKPPDPPPNGVLLTVKASVPFVTTGKYEKLLATAVSGTALLGRQQITLINGVESSYFCAMPAIRAIGCVDGAVQSVCADWIETLDVSRQAEYAMAAALVDGAYL